MRGFNRKSPQNFLGLFLLFSLANLGALLSASASDNYLTKPFLMIWLGAYVYARLRPLATTTARYLLVGLFFSFLGDTLLLFADGRPSGGLFFLLGLGSFLLTHVAYWLAFHNWPDQQKGTLARKPWLVIPFILYWGLMIRLLWPLPEGMEIPVLVYSAVIMIMAAKALHIGPGLLPGDQLMLLVGAILFVLSDSIIALSRFTDFLSGWGVMTAWAIMLTYLSGQLLIVLGVVRSLKAVKNRVKEKSAVDA
jgi:uncharacterized membrane protein YhhN